MVISCKTLLIPVFVFGFARSCFSAITSTDATPNVGCADTFATSIIGTSYQWEFGPNAYPETISGAGPGFMVAGTAFLTAGDHTVKVFITNGSQAVDSAIITVVANPNTPTTITAPNDTVCIGTGVWFYASPRPPTYSGYAFFVNDSLWQLSTADSFEYTPSHGDSVRVFGVDGVCFTGSANTIFPEIDSFPHITNSTTRDTICSGYTIVFTATPQWYDTVFFYNGGSLQQASLSNTFTTSTLGNGNNIFVIMKGNKCFEGYSNSDTIILKPTPQMTLTVVDSVICQGTPVTFTANATQSATDSFIFFVNGFEVASNSVSEPTYTSSTLNNGDTVTVEGSLNGCYSHMSAAITMVVNPPPTVTLTSSVTNDTICQGQPVTFTAVPGGYNNYNFLDGGSVSLQNGASNTFTTTALTSGNSISVDATNAGCPPSNSNAISIVVIPAPQVTLPSSGLSACASVAADTLTGFAPTGGTWSGNGIINNTGGIFSPSQAGPGTDSLTYTYFDSTTGCSSSPSLAFTVFPLPDVTITPASPTICGGHSVQLTASGAATYEWSPTAGLSDSTIANPVASPAISTTYIVTGTDNNGCTDTASVNVTVNQLNAITFTPPSATCSGQTVSFTVNTNPPPGTSVEWEFGDGGSSNASPTATHVYTSGNTYDVMLITTQGACSDTSSQQVIIFQNAVANFYATPTVAYANDSTPPVQFVNESSGAQTYSWNFGDQSGSTIYSPTHVYSNPGLYTVTLFVTNAAGCSDSLTQPDYILINPLPTMFIPNAFAPDGYNKILHVYAQGLKYMDWKIFNRSGELVYQSYDINTDISVGWDGNYKGVAAPTGVYVYTLKAVFEDGSQRLYKGSITLLR